MDFKVLVEGREVVSSGTIVVSESQSITYSLDDGVEKIVFHVAFGKDDTGLQRADNFHVSPNELKLVFMNYNTPLGFGAVLDKPFATVSDRQIFFSFVNYNIGDIVMMCYTFSRGAAQ